MPNQDFLANFLLNRTTSAAPRNLKFLSDAAGNVLSRVIPPGVNWGGLPTSFLSELDRINKMSPGAAKEAARTAAETTLTRSAVTPPVRPPISAAGPGGMLRAPALNTPSAAGTILSRGPVSQIPGSPVQFDPALRRQFGWTGGARQVAEKLVPQGSAVSAPSIKPSFAMAKELRAVPGALAKAGASVYAGWELFNQGRTGSLLDKALNAIPDTSDRDLGRMSYEALKKAGGQAMNETSYIANELLQGRLPYSSTGLAPVATTTPERPIANLPPNYKQTELEAGAAAEAFRSGADFPGQQLFVPPVPQLSPEELAYNQERSRIAQLTAATPEERSKLRDEGMRIWAAKYRDNLAKKVKPGQSGYEVIQQVLNK